MDQSPDSPQNDFSKLADSRPPTLVEEVIDFLRHNKKWWLSPLIIVLALVGLLAFLSTTAVAPFIYPLF